MTKREIFVRDLLHKHGIAAGNKGVEYLTEAIMTYEKAQLLTGEYGLYSTVAKKFPGATGARVERAMRHAISTSEDKGVTNGNFIAYMAYQLKKEDSKRARM